MSPRSEGEHVPRLGVSPRQEKPEITRKVNCTFLVRWVVLLCFLRHSREIFSFPFVGSSSVDLTKELLFHWQARVRKIIS